MATTAEKSVKIDCAFSAALYNQAVNDDGDRYDYCAGSYVIATSTGRDGERGYTDTWIYVGRDGDTTGNGGVYCFKDRDFDKFVDKVQSRGCINPAYWWNSERSYHDDLPDYVTNWYRPEYN